MPLNLYSKDSVDNLLADKLDLAGGTLTGALTLSASGIIFSDATYLTTAPAGATLAADQLTAGVVAANPTSGPTTAGDVLTYDGTDLVWQAGGGGGGVAWGAITGTLADQTDLQSAIDAKIDDAPSDGVAYGRKDAAWEPVLQPMIVINAGSNPYTLVAGDANNVVHSGGYDIKIPTDATYDFPIGTKIIVTGNNFGESILPESTGGGGNQPDINGSAASVSIGWGVTLVKINPDVWRVF